MLSLFSSDLAIDLGTANTCVYARGKGAVAADARIILHTDEETKEKE